MDTKLSIDDLAEVRLFVDDLVNTVRPAPEGWHGVATITEAIRILSNDNIVVSHISLDYDIARYPEEKVIDPSNPKYLASSFSNLACMSRLPDNRRVLPDPVPYLSIPILVCSLTSTCPAKPK